ncbi:unnamed protein product [Closterium sp. NIES-54]
MAEMALLLKEIEAHPQDVFCFVEEAILPTKLPFRDSGDGRVDPRPDWHLNIGFLFNAAGTVMCPPLKEPRAEPRAGRRVQSVASGVTGSGAATPPPLDDIVSRLRNPNYQHDFQTLALYGPHGADGECLADTVVDFHNIWSIPRLPPLRPLIPPVSQARRISLPAIPPVSCLNSRLPHVGTLRPLRPLPPFWPLIPPASQARMLSLPSTRCMPQVDSTLPCISSLRPLRPLPPLIPPPAPHTRRLSLPALLLCALLAPLFLPQCLCCYLPRV